MRIKWFSWFSVPKLSIDSYIETLAFVKDRACYMVYIQPQMKSLPLMLSVKYSTY